MREKMGKEGCLGAGGIVHLNKFPPYLPSLSRLKPKRYKAENDASQKKRMKKGGEVERATFLMIKRKTE